MGIDLLTGEHICFGLQVGSGCESCRKKYPHLLAKTPEAIEEGRRSMEQAVRAYSGVLDQKTPITTSVATDLNRFGYAGDNANRYELVEEPGQPRTSDRVAKDLHQPNPNAQLLHHIERQRSFIALTRPLPDLDKRQSWRVRLTRAFRVLRYTIPRILKK